VLRLAVSRRNSAPPNNVEHPDRHRSRVPASPRGQGGNPACRRPVLRPRREPGWSAVHECSGLSPSGSSVMRSASLLKCKSTGTSAFSWISRLRAASSCQRRP
jgi:hypothetical protein